MFEETGPEWLSEEVKTGVSTEFSLMSIRNLVNCYCAAQFLTSWLKRGYYRCRFIGINPEHSCCLCLQTTIIAIEFDGGVVLGSDSRVSAG